MKAPEFPARWRSRRARAGFTLVEVLLALAILGTTAVVLLGRRVEIVREAAASRDLRVAWMLAARKMAELELDRSLWGAAGGSAAGDFGQEDPAYAGFTWEYLVARRPVPIEDPHRPKDQIPPKPRELFHLALRIGIPGVEEPIVLESFFPVPAAEPEAEPPAGQNPQPGAPAGTSAGEGSP